MQKLEQMLEDAPDLEFPQERVPFGEYLRTFGQDLYRAAKTMGTIAGGARAPPFCAASYAVMGCLPAGAQEWLGEHFQVGGRQVYRPEMGTKLSIWLVKPALYTYAGAQLLGPYLETVGQGSALEGAFAGALVAGFEGVFRHAFAEGRVEEGKAFAAADPLFGLLSMPAKYVLNIKERTQTRLNSKGDA